MFDVSVQIFSRTATNIWHIEYLVVSAPLMVSVYIALFKFIITTDVCKTFLMTVKVMLCYL